MGKRRNSWVPMHSREIEPEITFVKEGAEVIEDLNADSAKFSQENTNFPISQFNLVDFPALEEKEFLSKQQINTSHEFHKRKRTLMQKILEHIGVAFYVFGFVFAPFVLTFISLTVLFFPPLWIFGFVYLAWFIYDYRSPKLGSHPLETFRSLRIWNWMANYFPMKLIKTADLPENRNYIVGAHPHGILSFGTFLTFCTEAGGFSRLFPNLKQRYAVTLPIQYWFPLRREWLMFCNTISSEMSAIEHVLQENDCGTVIGIVPGGAAEALNSSPNDYRLILKNRKGFIKLALRNGASLVPMYTFGEINTFKQLSNKEGSLIRRFQECLKNSIGITMPFFYGRGFINNLFGFMPFRTPLNAVVGKPIHVDKVEDPSDKQINELHKKYMKALSDLFDAHKNKYGIGPKAKLEFV